MAWCELNAGLGKAVDTEDQGETEKLFRHLNHDDGVENTRAINRIAIIYNRDNYDLSY